MKVAIGAKGIKRPCIFSGRRLAVAGHEDGIAVHLEGESKQSALAIPGCRVLERRDGLPVRNMVAMPWSAHEHWREMIHAAMAS